NRKLGQHFLVDENILGVIGRLAELDRGDVVLEVGPGLGVLTRYLADRVRRVHAVELDRALEPHLTAALEGHANVDVVYGDALRRKTLPNSLALAGHTDRARAAAALQQLGFPAATRAERLAPADFAALAELLS